MSLTRGKALAAESSSEREMAKDTRLSWILPAHDRNGKYRPLRTFGEAAQLILDAVDYKDPNVALPLRALTASMTQARDDPARAHHATHMLREFLISQELMAGE